MCCVLVIVFIFNKILMWVSTAIFIYGNKMYKNEVSHYFNTQLQLNRLLCDQECDDEAALCMDSLVRSPSLPIHSTSNHGSPSLWTIVMRLQNEVKTLKLDVKHLQMQLKDEKHDRILAIAAMQTKNIFKDAKESKC